MTAFGAIPASVEGLLTGAGSERLPGLPDRCARVGVVLLDAFGRRMLERHASHPFLRRLAVTDVRAQFPPTTTAHVTTMHTGRPLGEHGLYEWNVYEPAVDAVITPLLFSWAGSEARDTLRGALDPAVLVAGPTLYERLAAAGVPSTVLQPSAFSPSTFDGVAVAGARLQPFDALRDGVAAFFDALREPGYAYLYWDRIDGEGHEHGPDSPRFDAAAVAALDELEAGLRSRRDAVVVVTADHGQMAVDPARMDHLDELWSGLVPLLAHRPAGSARDVFLHTRPGAAPEVLAALRESLGRRAEVHAVDDLVAAGRFGAVGPRLRARLADVCVLPAPGRMAWLRAFPGAQSSFRGHHGGLHPDEVDTWAGVLALG